MNIYLDHFQFSKTVFILERFFPNKLFKSAGKGCLILVPRSDLLRARDFYGFHRLRIALKYRIFCPFSANMQGEGFNFFLLSPAKMEHFSWIRSIFADQNTNIASWGYNECLNSMAYSIKAFLSHYLIISHGGFRSQPREANLKYTGQQMSWNSMPQDLNRRIKPLIKTFW